MPSLPDDWFPQPLPLRDPGMEVLAAAVHAAPETVYAAIDGARHPGIARLLKARGIPALALWLEQPEGGPREKGPWLAELRDARARADALEALGEHPQAVFWRWPHGHWPLARHLRHLNLVEIPREAPIRDGFPGYETVHFRHWDPEVLGPLLPLMRRDQSVFLVGHAPGLIFHTHRYGGLATLDAPTGPRPAPGRSLLRFEPEQVERLEYARFLAMIPEAGDYLDETAPSWSANLADRDGFMREVADWSWRLGMRDLDALTACIALLVAREELRPHLGDVAELLADPGHGTDPNHRARRIVEAIDAWIARTGGVS